jgi:hypothetical protein
MTQKIITIIRKLLVVSGGGLGGFVVGCILSLSFFHASKVFEMHIFPLGVVIPGTLILCIVAGLVYPRFFSYYFLVLLLFLTCEKEDKVRKWRMELLTIAYFLGFVGFLFGVITCRSWIVGAGLLGIIVFTIGIPRIQADANKT